MFIISKNIKITQCVSMKLTLKWNNILIKDDNFYTDRWSLDWTLYYKK